MSHQPKQPLAEVFGFPADDLSKNAEYHRENHICPFTSTLCSKGGTTNPVGICSNNYTLAQPPAITCPSRIMENGLVPDLAAKFFFRDSGAYELVPEVPLHLADGEKAGNIDFVPTRFTAEGDVSDWGALEVQTVYMSNSKQGDLFASYMDDRLSLVGRPLKDGGHPDWKSSSKKRLVPQLISKAPLVVDGFGKRFAVCVQSALVDSLPKMDVVKEQDAQMAFFLVDIETTSSGALELVHSGTLYMRLDDTLAAFAHQAGGDLALFEAALKKRHAVRTRAALLAEKRAAKALAQEN